LKARGFQPEPPRFRPVAVVDIGSNSVRLVVYDGLRRSPSPVFNEKILCGLGRGLALTGALSEEGVARALPALRRFSALCGQMKVSDIFAVATAAARDAANGVAFVKEAEQALGARVAVLTGKREAELAALGVISGLPVADGIVGDLGGGSLELVDIRNGEIRDGATLPLGPLRLIDLSGGSMDKAREIVDEALSKTKLIDKLKGREFYAVGGTWRNLARLHMAKSGYPLSILHGYTVSREGARSVAELVAGLSPSSLRSIAAVSRSRADTLPFGAMVLERILARSKAKHLVVSVFGVREGLLFSKLKKRKRDADPLLSACWDFARRYSRSPVHELELCDWTDRLFGVGPLKETPAERRLRHAACMLADISWRASPDYRGNRALTLVSQASFVGTDHVGRVFLALTVYFRYEGPMSEDAPPELVRMVGEDMLERSRQIAAAQRLAYVLTAAMPGLLPRIGIEYGPGKSLNLHLEGKLADLNGEPVQKRFEGLAQLLGRTGQLRLA